MHAFETIDLSHLHHVTGGQAPAPGGQGQQPQRSAYETTGNPVQQGGQMVDNAVKAYQGARKAGASWYESLGNAAIGFFNLDGGFDPNGRPR
jgi:hypothetical protein